jgi:EmrB/QacA subfamily drug resistance transporter
MIPYGTICYGFFVGQAVDIRAGADRGDRSRWIALVVLCVGMLMIILDQTIVNVALPSIQSDLGFKQSSLAWVVNAYLIAFGGLLLLAGRLGDLAGRRGVFMVGLAVFVGASLVCGLAQSQAVLVGARFVQGAGGALTSAVILGMIVTMFPEPRDQARAIGVYSFVAAAGASIGLLLGGVITQAINWHWIFFVNLPIGVVTAILALRLVDRDEGIGFARGADVAGALLLVSALMLGVYTIVEVPNYGWGSLHTLGFGAVAAALLAAFVAREGRAQSPLVPLRTFRARNTAGANLVVSLMVGGMFGMFFLGALFMQRVLGYDAIQVGLAFLPVALIIGALSLGASARLNLRFGPRATLVPGLALIVAGLLLFARAPLGASYAIDLLPSMLLLGIGAGLCFPSLMTLAMSAATPSEAGLASGLVNTTTQVGGALGLAVLATLSTTRTESLSAGGDSLASALTGGYHLAFLIGAGLVVAALGLALTVLERAPEVAGEAAEAELPADAEPAYSEAA